MVTVVFIGAGRLASNLAAAMQASGEFVIRQVYSRTELSAKSLADELHTAYTIDPRQVVDGADLYVVAVSDESIATIVSSIPIFSGIWVHTAGSIDLSVLAPCRERYGVFYPFQTFTKGHRVDFSRMPIYVEGCNAEVEAFLHQVASSLSSNVIHATSAQRGKLHIAAVFACNFVNGCYAIAADLLKEADLKFEDLLPLIDETAVKVHTVAPVDAQTGPAVRNDRDIMNRHIDQLSDPSLKEIYRIMSERIMERSKKRQ